MGNYNRPCTYSTKVGSNPVTTNTVQRLEQEFDNRPLPVHTKKAKWRPPTPYYRSIQTGNVNTYDCVGRDQYTSKSGGTVVKTDWAGAFNCGGGFYGTIPAFPSNMESQAIIKARLKLKNQQINLGNAFGERAQCARLVGDNARRIANLFDHVRRRNFFLPANQRPKPIDFHKAYLELQYGVKPLMSDVYGAVSALENKEKDAGRGHVTVKASVKSRDFSVSARGDGVSTIAWTIDRVREVQHQGFIRLDFYQDNPILASLNSLGVTNPLEVAWELTPYSFVVDWFLPIGDYLNSLDATLGWRFLAGSMSKKTTVKVHASNFRMNSSSEYTKRSSYGVCSGSGKQMQFTRTVYGSAPLPSLPSFAKLGRKSVDHATNGIALLATAIAGWTKVR